MNIAVITGASSGLGMEFAKAVIEKYPNIDEFWLIARRKDRLETFEKKYKDRKFCLLSLDLAEKTSFKALSELLNEKKPTIQILINNAGFEREGRFDTMPSKDILSMLNLNIMGMTMLNHVCIPYMPKNSFEVITGSVSSFIPVPNQAVYSASKAYVRFYAKALREEMKRKGINIFLFSPGNMDTEMNIKSKARAHHSKIATLPYLNIQKETRKVLQKAESGKGVYTPLLFYKAYRLVGKIVPSAIMVKLTTIEDKGER